MIVLDTNVVSEPLKPAPAAKPVAWLRDMDIASLYLTTITVAELHAGLRLMPAGKRQDALRVGLNDLVTAFGDRILPLDLAASLTFGAVVARARGVGNTMKFADAAIASIALANRFAVATRDVGDFRGSGVTIINPWD